MPWSLVSSRSTSTSSRCADWYHGHGRSTWCCMVTCHHDHAMPFMENTWVDTMAGMACTDISHNHWCWCTPGSIRLPGVHGVLVIMIIMTMSGMIDSQHARQRAKGP